MAMIENLLECLGLDCELTPYRFRYYVYGRCGGWFEGVKIDSYTPDEVIFGVKGGRLVVTGKSMAVKKYVENEVALSGEILKVEIK